MYSTDLLHLQAQDLTCKTFPPLWRGVARKTERQATIELLEAARDRGMITERAAAKALEGALNGRFSIRRAVILCCSGALQPAKRRAEVVELLVAIGGGQ